MTKIRVPIAPGMFNMLPEDHPDAIRYLARQQRAMLRKAAPPPSACRHFGKELGWVDCLPCQKKGKNGKLMSYSCGLHGICTPVTTVANTACCTGCLNNTARIEPTISLVPIPQQYRKGYAFNPAMIEWQGNLLLAWRDNQNAGSHIWIGELDPRIMQLRKTPHRLTLKHPKAVQGEEDPRFFIWKNKLHLSFAGVQPVKGKTLVHVLFAQLDDNLSVDHIWEPVYAQRNLVEKNWVQFTWHDQLFSVYYPGNKHRILHHDNNISRIFAETDTKLSKEARGGATPVLVGNEFYHFFHTSKKVGSFWEYTIGLYTFSAEPPFAPIRMVKGPLYIPNHRERPIGFNKSVIFPCGAVHRDGLWLLSCGVHDMECRILAFNQAEVERVLVPL